MMKKSVLHYVADDRYGVFKHKEEAQFEMLLLLINDYNVDEEITTADQHGNHVRYLLLFLLIIVIINTDLYYLMMMMMMMAYDDNEQTAHIS